METFTIDNGSVDALSKELHRFGVMDLYRMSHTAHLEGPTVGAYCIQRFIFNQYSARIPFKVKIGEGTRLGYSSLGTVLHPDTIIGKNCLTGQNVTLGSRGDSTPVVGNKVYIGRQMPRREDRQRRGRCQRCRHL
ncbi:hypothetical protein [Arthrobacter crusticola]|uniref:hypothetical protein n=1 Tax=Arthrobacter crusticola TaxID=2547960 RepID=UPI001623CD51|nr:hypothetical protein [Arthrobacter crusticola]